jgi:hypothetical protein
MQTTAAPGLVELLKLPGPFDSVPLRYADVVRDSVLRFGDRTGEITPAHAELDWDEPLVALVIDERGARVQRDRRQIL